MTMKFYQSKLSGPIFDLRLIRYVPVFFVSKNSKRENNKNKSRIRDSSTNATVPDQKKLKFIERQRINYLRAQMQQEGIPVNHMSTKLDKILSQKRCRLSLQLFLTVRL